jgi:hypothetical protein
MERTMKKRNVIALVALLAVTALLSITATAALAKLTSEAKPRASTAPAEATQVGEAVTLTSCGRDVSRVFKTDTAFAPATGPTYTTLTSTTVVVPSGQRRCILVTFSAITACYGDAGANNDFCYVRVTDNGLPITSAGTRASSSRLRRVSGMPPEGWRIDSESDTPEAHMMQVVDVLGPGSHVIALQRRDDGGMTDLHLKDYEARFAVFHGV